VGVLDKGRQESDGVLLVAPDYEGVSLVQPVALDGLSVVGLDGLLVKALGTGLDSVGRYAHLGIDVNLGPALGGLLDLHGNPVLERHSVLNGFRGLADGLPRLDLRLHLNDGCLATPLLGGLGRGRGRSVALRNGYDLGLKVRKSLYQVVNIDLGVLIVGSNGVVVGFLCHIYPSVLGSMVMALGLRPLGLDSEYAMGSGIYTFEAPSIVLYRYQ